MTPAGGVVLLIQALAHCMPPSSRHIGSLPGLFGLSGMQVKLFLPLRRVFICMLSSMTTMVASLATAGGAADMAFLIRAASLAPSEAPAVPASRAAASGMKTLRRCIASSANDRRRPAMEARGRAPRRFTQQTRPRGQPGSGVSPRPTANRFRTIAETSTPALAAIEAVEGAERSEERRVGKEGRARRAPEH